MPIGIYDVYYHCIHQILASVEGERPKFLKKKHSETQSLNFKGVGTDNNCSIALQQFWSTTAY